MNLWLEQNYWFSNLCVIAGTLIVVLLCRSLLRSPRWERAWARFRKDRVGQICVVLIGLYLLMGVLASIELPLQSSSRQRLTIVDYFFRSVPREKSYSAPLARTTYEVNKPEPLKGRHLFGTDVLGKDVLLQTLKGCRTALVIGGLTSLISIPIGVLLGIAAGFYKRRVDDVIQYIYSTVSSIPNILLLIAILMALGKGLGTMSVALGITGWVGLCRLIRGETLRQTGRPYVEAARALGQSNWNIIVRHILPNVMHLVLINFILGFSGLVMAESILSYIGVGAPVGSASWGLMIDSARMELAREPMVWWNVTAAILALFFLVLPLNLLGDSLRRAFDPKAQ